MSILTHYMDPLLFRAYGRNVQNLARRIQQEPDLEKRTAYAQAMIPIMIAVNQDIQYNTASIEKVWQDLFRLAGGKLDIASPYKLIPDNPSIRKRVILPYNKPLQRKYNPFGRHILKLLKAIEVKNDKAYSESALLHIAKWLLTFHKKGTNVAHIIGFFQDNLATEALPDLLAIKEELERFAPSHTNSYHRPKRFFKKKRKP